MRFSEDGKVSFDEDTHTYMLGDKKLYGITSYISRFKNKFDVEGLSLKESLRTGIPQSEILKRWKDKADASVNQGTAVHKVFEDFINTGIAQTSLEYPKTLVAAKFIQEMFKSGRLTPVACEYIVYNEKYASMIDLIAKNTKDEYFIFDYKTNETISKDGWGKRMLEPYNLLPDASYYHYSLQTSIYKFLYKKHPIKDCFIVHIKNEDYEIVKPEKILINYL